VLLQYKQYASIAIDKLTIALESIDLLRTVVSRKRISAALKLTCLTRWLQKVMRCCN